MSLLDHCPAAPDWYIDWDAIRSKYDWVEALHQCEQDPEFHSEGDVGIHTRMVCEALAGSDQFRRLSREDQQTVFAGALLHDVAKPDCSKREGGQISSRGHSRRGEIKARRILWQEKVPFDLRESICGLVLYHQVPFYLVERDDSLKLAYSVSQVARCDLLALLAWADGCGRCCVDGADLPMFLDNVSFFSEYCAEHKCLVEPRRFASDHSRFQYFHKDNRDSDYHAHDDTKCEVILLSGLPAAGKDHWINNNISDWPVISLDAIRAELGISPGGVQNRVVTEGKQRAKQFLREKKSFAWNATNISRHIRRELISLFVAYNARVRIKYVEGTANAIAIRNQNRKEPVPPSVMQTLLGRWTVPSVIEAHTVEIILSD